MNKKTLVAVSRRFMAAALAGAMLASLAACSATSGASGVKYTVTPENENEELILKNQPESSYWFPDTLLEWNAKDDPDLAYNVSTVPLAKRVDKKDLKAVNKTQNTDTKVMAISIMNSSTSGNAPHGLNNANANTFSYWQYVDQLVYWGGSSGEGIIVPPSPDVTDMAHTNGVPVLGTVFFPQNVSGGKVEWLDQTLAQDADGSFPVADKLIEVAQTYGFDGWFINQETEGDNETALGAKYAEKMQAFIKYLKEQAPDLRVVYYDSMTKDGAIDWQNALTDENKMFMTDGKTQVADDMFLNFWWTEDELADKNLLKASADKAAEIGVDPYSLYAGVDVQANGYDTPVKWNLLAGSDGKTHTSLGLYCPSWAYWAAGNPTTFRANESRLWVNKAGDPSQNDSYDGDEAWQGVSNYVVEQSAITSLPFVTNFNNGSGYSFFRDGEQISKMDWNNRSVSDIQPTYRWTVSDQGGNKTKADYSDAEAWYGGSSLKFSGVVKKGGSTDVRLYSANVKLADKTELSMTAKANASTELDAVLTFADGTSETVAPKSNKKIGEDWTTVTYDVSKYAGKSMTGFDITYKSDEDKAGYQLLLGNITLKDGAEKTSAGKVTSVAVGDKQFDDDAIYAGVRLSWKADGDAAAYEVYKINEDKSRSFLGISNVENFYAASLTRTGETNNTTFEVVPVDRYGNQGTSAKTDMEWPDNSKPKAAATASRTLIGVGDEVTFTSASSKNTKSVSWSLPGSSKEKADGDKVTVTYDKEGVYDVEITAKNDSGEATTKLAGEIVVSSKIKSGASLTLLSQGKATEADGFTNSNEQPAFAVDGDTSKKWCVTGPAPHEITVDLGDVKTVSQIDIAHAQAGGEDASMNTQAYSIAVSQDGKEFTTVATVKKNTAGTTSDAFAPVDARYVKLVVDKPTQGSDTAARIYELQVLGADGSVL
ncbi:MULTISPECIES: endo-beta-N-acetylglucosaminidase [Bifidobacterium]|uniref:endo-beta-N-acetylglucosaminidase n=1 Tax=Bifidobacterium TaxID=1678 RepID=UPI001BDCE03F|nr:MULTISPECIES: discoidin domain-containing protein [Bifidobacterium]MBT1160869.1 discoidin domain-containing protein [Bifidobacterium sp. SO1]MBW3077668.1 discoidin domain-containing protein [Bifidobacterium simiiventris]